MDEMEIVTTISETVTTVVESLTTAAEALPEPPTITEVLTQSAPSLTPNPENVMHNLFFILGCDLDHVPINEFEAFTMALQFLAALFFLIWFCKFMYQMMRPFLRGGL